MPSPLFRPILENKSSKRFKKCLTKRAGTSGPEGKEF